MVHPLTGQFVQVNGQSCLDTSPGETDQPRVTPTFDPSVMGTDWTSYSCPHPGSVAEGVNAMARLNDKFLIKKYYFVTNWLDASNNAGVDVPSLDQRYRFPDAQNEQLPPVELERLSRELRYAIGQVEKFQRNLRADRWFEKTPKARLATLQKIANGCEPIYMRKGTLPNWTYGYDNLVPGPVNVDHPPDDAAFP